MALEFQKPLSPRERQERNRREMTGAILAAARLIMRRDGVAALNLHEIARMVGVQPPPSTSASPARPPSTTSSTGVA